MLRRSWLKATQPTFGLGWMPAAASCNCHTTVFGSSQRLSSGPWAIDDAPVELRFPGALVAPRTHIWHERSERHPLREITDHSHRDSPTPASCAARSKSAFLLSALFRACGG